LGYWNHGEYLGLGAGAHSFLKSLSAEGKVVGERWSNIGNYQTYIQQVGAGSVRAWQEQVVDEALLFEAFFVGLRKVTGVDCRRVLDELGVDPRVRYQQQFAELMQAGLLTIEGEVVAATPRGMLLLNSVLDQLIITP
jgi:oxygen-independent coproporphyrinogen III oxidase